MVWQILSLKNAVPVDGGKQHAKVKSPMIKKKKISTRNRIIKSKSYNNDAS